MEKEILNMEEAAELFGVSIKTFIKLLKEEKVPGRKIGREWRFSRRALIEWLSSGDSQQYSQSESDTREFFNQVANDWEDLRSHYYDESIKNWLLSSSLLKRDMTVLDAGAGDGYISRAVAKLVKKVIAVDLSGKMLQELKRKAREEGTANIETIESDGRATGLLDDSIDLICANMYLHHFEEPSAAILEMKRILKPGGRVFIADFYEHQNQRLMEEMHDVWPGFSEKEIIAMFKKLQFRDIRLEPLQTGSEQSKLKIFIVTALKSK